MGILTFKTRLHNYKRAKQTNDCNKNCKIDNNNIINNIENNRQVFNINKAFIK